MSRSRFGRIALFVDGANLYATVKALGFEMDFRRLLTEFQGRGHMLRAYYYTAVFDDVEASATRPLVDWLSYNGYVVVTKTVKEFLEPSGRRKVKFNMNTELAVNALEISDHVDEIILFSGDGDLRPLVEALQRRGVRVTIISSIACSPPMVADDLRRQADSFIDLVDLQSKIGRDPSERAPGRSPIDRPPRGENP